MPQPVRKYDEELLFEGKQGQRVKALTNLWEFRYNRITLKIEYRTLRNGKAIDDNWKLYDDNMRSTVYSILNLSDLKIVISDLDRLIESNLICSDYDPFKIYFNNIEYWDQETDYIKQLAETVTVREEDKERFEITLKKWLVGSLYCLLGSENPNEICLIFQGIQGAGKTRWFRKILPQQFKDRYFDEVNINPNNDDHILKLAQFWIIQLDELESLTSQKIGLMKAFISKVFISLRKAYGRYDNQYSRRASFCGSVNDGVFLTDPTGSRRWLVFKVLKIDYDHNVDIEGVWKQAYHLYTTGFRAWMNAEEVREVNRANEEFREVSIEEQLVLEIFYFPEKDETGAWKSCSEVLEAISIKKPTLKNLKTQILGRTLGKYSKIKKKSSVNKYWVLEKDSSGDDDLPF